jgi:hypothetical protein
MEENDATLHISSAVAILLLILLEYTECTPQIGNVLIYPRYSTE